MFVRTSGAIFAPWNAQNTSQRKNSHQISKHGFCMCQTVVSNMSQISPSWGWRSEHGIPRLPQLKWWFEGRLDGLVLGKLFCDRNAPIGSRKTISDRIWSGYLPNMSFWLRIEIHLGCEISETTWQIGLKIHFYWEKYPNAKEQPRKRDSDHSKRALHIRHGFLMFSDWKWTIDQILWKW